MLMRTITLIIIHCSATPEGRRLDFETCRRDHIRHRGFTDIGYHFYITRDGEIHRGDAPWKRWERIAGTITGILSASAMRVDSWRTAHLPIRVL